jgi:hypothetical protein
MQRDGFHISFMLPDMKTHQPLKLTFRTYPKGKIFEMLDKWGEDKSEEHRAKLECEIGLGRLGETGSS